MDIGVYEAKTHLPDLLSRVTRGEQVTITRHGKAIARLVPVEPDSRRNVLEVISELKSFAKGRRSGLSVRDMIAEGRR